MNVENINTLIEWVKTRSWKTLSWDSEAMCFVGMIKQAFPDWFQDWKVSSLALLSETLDIDGTTPIDLYVFQGTNDTLTRGEFERMDVKQQNAVLVKTLEHLRDTGEVRFSYADA